MIPFLYDATATSNAAGYLGKLTGAISCQVTESLDGEYELIMNYDPNGNLFDKIDYNKLILAKPNGVDQAQLFRIYRINKQAKGKVTIYARHISYDLEGAPVMPFSFYGILDFFEKLKYYQVSSHIFSFDVNGVFANGNESGEISTPENMRNIIYKTGMPLFDCEIKWNNTQAEVVPARGENTHTVRYGKNLVDVVSDGIVTDFYTGVLPYYIENEVPHYLPEQVVQIEGNFGFERILILDLTNAISDSGSVFSEDALREETDKYIEDNKIGEPRVSIQLDVVNQFDFGEIPYDDKILLGDFFEIEFPKLKISATARCVSVTWDVIRERYLNYYIES